MMVKCGGMTFGHIIVTVDPFCCSHFKVLLTVFFVAPEGVSVKSDKYHLVMSLESAED